MDYTSCGSGIFLNMVISTLKLAFTHYLFLVLFGPMSSALSVSSSRSGFAVVGCGVLGTSLCKQFLESSEFKDSKSKLSLLVIDFFLNNQKLKIVLFTSYWHYKDIQSSQSYFRRSRRRFGKDFAKDG